ncbi:MAG: outer membrane protein assembly factor BamB [Beggiatoa sp.]|nr:outer membrane protein assembly factor BamB [Beggiatoa sp.]
MALLAVLPGCGIPEYMNDLLEDEEPAQVLTPLRELEPSIAIQELWTDDVGEGADALFLKLAPAAAEGTVYVADREGTVSAIGIDSGDTLWERDTDLPISGGPGLGEGLVLVGTSDGEVLALSQADGSLVWTATVSSEVLAAPRIEDGVAVVRTGDGKVFGIDATAGTRVWVYDKQVPVLTLRGTSAPVLSEDLAIVGFDSGALVALEVKTGKPAWEIGVAQPRGRSDLERMVDIDAEPVVYDENLYVATFQGRVAALDLDDGELVWDKTLSSYAGLGIDEDNVYVSDDRSHVFSLDRLAGSANWEQEELAGRSLTAPARAGGFVVVGDVEGYLHWLGREDGQLAARVRLDDERIMATPLIVDDVVIGYSSGGTLGAYRIAP